MPGISKLSDPPEEAKFLFKGTVRTPSASAMAQVPKGADTAIVHVDEILHAPPALAKTLGQLITVKFAKGTKPTAGTQLLFHANGWLFGETIAVISLKQEKPPATKTMLAARAADPTRNLADRELEKRVSDADMVIEGQVSSVHLPQAQRLAASEADSARPRSEHDPKWREAVIDVAAVHKGKLSTKQVVVRFPSSMDVQWHRAPKFRTGDRGVWMLHRPQAPPAAAAPKAMAIAPPGGAVYTALHPMDFQPANKLDTVAPVILAAVGGAHS